MDNPPGLSEVPNWSIGRAANLHILTPIFAPQKRETWLNVGVHAVCADYSTVVEVQWECLPEYVSRRS